MLFLLATWIVLGTCALAIGHAILKLLAEQPARPGDWLILSLYVGLVALEWLMLGLSLGAADSWRNALLVAGAVVIASLAYAGGTLTSMLRPLLRLDVVVSAALIAAAAGFTAAGLRPTPDTGDYHYPAIRWLAEFGSVAGVALLIDRVGFVSSVFSLVAPFDAAFPGHALPVVNGFMLCLVAGQTVLAMHRIIRSSARPSDWFLVAASLAVLGIGLLIGSFTTPTPDVSVMVLTTAAAWRMLAAGESSNSRSLVPLILCGGALAAKLSGLLLVPVAGLYAVWGSHDRRWLTASLIAAGLAMPFALSSFVTSGCFALPVQLTCIPVAWGLDRSTVQDISFWVTAWGRWGGPPPVGAGPLDWIPLWLAGRTSWLNAALFWQFVLFLALYWRLARKSLHPAERWLLALIAPSTVLLFVTSPDTRFNFGLFIVPASLVAMRILPKAFATRVRAPTFARSPALACTAVVTAMLVAYSIAIDRYRREPATLDRLIEPRAAPSSPVTSHTSALLTYGVPATGYGCWGAPLPCADHLLDGIELRAPERGLAGGLTKRRSL